MTPRTAPPPPHSRWRLVSAAAVLSVIVAGPAVSAGSSGPSPAAGSVEAAAPAPACPPGLEPVSVGGSAVSCTHGPDPAPADVVVNRPRALVAGAVASLDAPSVPCYGDGTSGRRVQAVYAFPADRPDRYDAVLPSIGRWAAQTDQVFAASAARTGGVRHVRFVTDASCGLVVLKVALSATGDDTIQRTAAELDALGLNRSDRKYLVWTDSTVMCGTAGYYVDDRAGAHNANNGTAPGQLARVDSGCWGLGGPGRSVEAHELMHTLGGVQPSAPHATPAGHCSDGADQMCYADGTPGQTMLSVCPTEPAMLFDCGEDDYFSLAPKAASYLATHWNTADSSFLATEPPPSGTAPVTVPAVVPAPPATALPAPAPTLSAPATAVAGVVTRVSGTARPGATVELWGVTAPAATLTRIATAAVTADQNGSWATTIRPLRNVNLQAREGDLRSTTRYIAVATALTQSVSALSGCVVQISGRSFEPKPGATVFVRARTLSGSTVELGRALVVLDGRYLLRRVYPCGQSLTVYSVVAGDAVNRPGASIVSQVQTRR